MRKLMIDNKTGIVENAIVVADDAFQIEGKTLIASDEDKVGHVYDFSLECFIDTRPKQPDSEVMEEKI